MAGKFRGVVNLDIKYWIPDWGPYEGGGEAVTDDYPGTAPWAFTGGTLHRVAVDVSGRPYADMEREAAAMLSRE